MSLNLGVHHYVFVHGKSNGTICRHLRLTWVANAICVHFGHLKDIMSKFVTLVLNILESWSWCLSPGFGPCYIFHFIIIVLLVTVLITSSLVPNNGTQTNLVIARSQGCLAYLTYIHQIIHTYGCHWFKKSRKPGR